ncbi:hypothetical protein HJD18_06105 [Thermoleophilia bacterium SCSIO 60948]|nr:hypothetical protein HJD18_06105 [Thermoleophilia bacterium SCSIO 60948]
MKSRLVLLAGLVLLLLLLPASAASARPVSSKTQSIPGVQGAQVEIAVKCPRGRNFVSGGFAASSRAALDGLSIVEGSWDGRRTWTVTALRSTNSTVARTATALARCGKTTPKLTIRRARKAPSGAEPDGTMRVQASCGKGRSAISGGFVQPTLDTSFAGGGAVVENRRIGSADWAVSTSPFISAGSLRAEAYCGKDRGTFSDSHTESLGGYGTTTTATTDACRNEAHAGGWRIESEPDGFLPLIHASEPSGKTWSVSISDLQGGFTGALTGYAYCP